MLMLRTIAEIYHRLPLKGGQTRLSFNPLIERLMRGLEAPQTARLWDGSHMQVDPHDYHGRILMLFGTNDIKVSLTANALLRPGDAFLDIGANYASIGLYASHAVGPAGAVHLFEPQKRIADAVAATIAASGYRNVVLHRCGLMDVDTTLTIRAPSGHSGRATFAGHNQTGEFADVETCVVHEIGAYAGPLVKGRPFGVKLDIEGSEPLVMPWLLAQPNLRFMIFEANHHLETLFDLVLRSGLKLFGLQRRPLRMRLGLIDRFDKLKNYHDVVALRLGDVQPLPEQLSLPEAARLMVADQSTRLRPSTTT